MVMHIQRHTITCEIDTETYRGTYWVAGKILTVSTGKAGKSRQVGAIPNEVLARQMLEALARDGKAYLTTAVASSELQP